jgi:hypothetical protein
VPALALLAAVGAAKSPKPKIDPQADAELRKMSDYLAGLKSFRVTSLAEDEAVTKSGERLDNLAESKIAVKRPNMLRSDRTTPDTDVTFRYDGKQFVVFSEQSGFYAMAPAPDKLDKAIDVARDEYGLDAPGADLLMSDPYAVLTEDVTSGKDLGLEPIDGVPCHHLAFQGKDVDFQIWIEEGARPLPHRYVIVSKHEPGKPEFTVQLRDWQPDASLSGEIFAFQPPPGSQRIDFITAKSVAKTKKG